MIKAINKSGGRPAKADPATHSYKVRFNSAEHARFLTLYELSGLSSKATFIKSRIFDESFRVVKVDRTLLDYYQKLSALYGQFRAVGVNYNQVVVALKMNFTERKALSMLYRLERSTIDLTSICHKILTLTEEFKRQWSQR
ncbi:MAG: conjugal transfer protein MobA [Rikenellaceae bacterium]